jgi:hypothetical protein
MAQKSQQVAQQSELAQRDAQTKQAMAQQEMANKQQAHEMDMESKAAVLHHATQGKMAQGLATIIASGAAQHQELSHKEQAHTQTMRHNEEISKSKQLQMKNSSTGKTRK